MKKYISIIPITLMSILISCKKGDTPKDYGASIKDKSWWGTITYTGKTAEYYSVHYNADSSLVWNQFSGEYNGKWSINDNRLTMNFTSNDVQIKADISEDDKLLNIRDNAGYYDVNSGELNSSPNIIIDNTIWKGTFNNPDPLVFQLDFKPGQIVEMKIGNSVYPGVSYARSESNVIRFLSAIGAPFFGVLTTGNELKGCYISEKQLWQGTKQ